MLLFLTDAAAYMIKAASKIKERYPKMIHLTCLAHGVHRIAEEIRHYFSDVDQFISNMKKIFIKAPSRKQKFKEVASGVPLPPQPVLTRWGTWLQAAIYYFEHYNQIIGVVNTFDAEDSSAIKVVKSLLSQKLHQNLEIINYEFKDVPLTIKQLESSEMAMSDSLQLVENLSQKFSESGRSLAAEIAKQKLKYVLQKNPGYSAVCNIRNFMLNNENPCNSKLDSCDMPYFRFALITSYEIERSFSKYKICLDTNPRSFLSNFTKVYYYSL